MAVIAGQQLKQVSDNKRNGVMNVTNIFIHGLGQNETSWDAVEAQLIMEHDRKAEKPNLYSMIKGRKADYDTLLQTFTDYCNDFDGKLNVCGLSLGGILALDYTKRFPDKVNSMILIGTPCEIPKMLFKLQWILFHLTPKTAFEKIGCSKKDFMSLVGSMVDLDISDALDQIQCKTLVLCGAKDKANRNSAQLLNRQIKGSLLRIVDNASHEVNVHNPTELSRVIKEFWSEQ